MNLRLSFILLLVYLHPAAQEKKQLDTKIEKVTVFLDGAQVERTYKGMIPAGKHQLVFGNISPNVDKQSIQVKAEGNTTVLSVLHQQNFLRQQKQLTEIKELEEKRDQFSMTLVSVNNTMAVFTQEENMLLKNQEIGGNNGLKATDLKESLDFQRARLTEIYQKKQDLTREISRITAEKNRIIRQLSELNQKADLSTSEIIVTVQSKSASAASFTISYLVKNAGWYPTYDIRVKDISSPITLQSKANIFQHSGEDWKEVKIFLSTGNPNEKGDKPVIRPWYLRYNTFYPVNPSKGYQYTPAAGTVSGRITDDKGMPLPGTTIVLKGTKTGVSADNNGNFSLNTQDPSNILMISSVGFETKEVNVSRGTIVNITMNPVSNTLEEVVVVGYGTSSDGNDAGLNYSTTGSYRRKKEKSAIETVTTYQPTTVIYEIKDPYSVPDDGKTYTADIDAYEIDAGYEYYCVPKLEPDVYLTALINDWQELNLQPGEASLFFEGTYLGQSFLDVINAGDTLKLSLGKDKGVVVKRTLLKEFSTRKFLGGSNTDSRQYEISIRNNKQLPVNLTIEDQFPVSTEKEIEIKDRKYEGARLDDDSQKLTWQLHIEPKKEISLRMGYDVKYPKEKTIHLE